MVLHRWKGWRASSTKGAKAFCCWHFKRIQSSVASKEETALYGRVLGSRCKGTGLWICLASSVMGDINEGSAEDLQVGRAHSLDLSRVRAQQYLSLQSTVFSKGPLQKPVYYRSVNHSKHLLKD